MIKFFIIYLGILTCWTGVTSAANDDVKIVTSNLAPYSIDMGLRPGFMVEILFLIENRLGTNRVPDFYPWTRAQMLARTQSNHIIFPLTRTLEREKSYDWLIDVAPIEYVFVTLKGEILSLENAKKLAHITVQQSTPFEQFLKQEQFSNLIITPNTAKTHLRLLESGRVQAWFTSKALAQYAIKDKKYASKTKRKTSFKMSIPFKMSSPFKTSRVFFASSKQFPHDIKRAYQRVFSELVKEGKIGQILNQYR